jgi:hypothetical protein
MSQDGELVKLTIVGDGERRRKGQGGGGAATAVAKQAYHNLKLISEYRFVVRKCIILYSILSSTHAGPGD